MLISDAIKSRILELMKFHNIPNIHNLALLAGIPYASLNDFFRNKTELIRIDKLIHICEVFNIELKDFFDSPLFKNVDCNDR